MEVEAAACRSHPDPDSLWHADGRQMQRRREAIRICLDECPALNACAAYALGEFKIFDDPIRLAEFVIAGMTTDELYAIRGDSMIERHRGEADGEQPRCEVRGCNRRSRTSGLCTSHFEGVKRARALGVREPTAAEMTPIDPWHRSSKGRPAVCAVAGCGLPVGDSPLCQSHHETRQRAIDWALELIGAEVVVLAPYPAPERPAPETCTRPGCSERVVGLASMLCHDHYQAAAIEALAAAGMPPLPPPREEPGGTRRKRKTCRINGCDSPAAARSLCDKHYAHNRKSLFEGRGEIPDNFVAPSDGPPGDKLSCRVIGCEKPTRSSGLCKNHYSINLHWRKVGWGEIPDDYRPRVSAAAR